MHVASRLQEKKPTEQNHKCFILPKSGIGFCGIF